MTYNSAYTGPQIDKAARLASIIFDDLPAMLADDRDYTAHTAGDVFWTATEGFRYRVAASGAADHHLTTAGGVKLYVQPEGGIYNFRAFNPAADGATDDHPVLVKALAAEMNVDGNGPTIYFPDGTYYMGSTVELISCVRLIGGGPGTGASPADATLLFAADTLGVCVNRSDTLSTGLRTAAAGADGSVIEGLSIESAGGTNTDKHGVWLRARAVIKRCHIRYFPGNGLYIRASFNDGTPLVKGNANCFLVENCYIQGNKRNGIYIDGADTNAGTFTNVDSTQNGRWGIYDSSFLGNNYIGCHTDANGLAGKGGNTSSQSCFVSYGGNHYQARPTATEAQLVATTPGTDEAIWSLRGVGEPNGPTGIPTWVAAQAEGTYFPGGGIRTEGAVNYSAFIGCYNEAPYAMSITGPSVVLGGHMLNYLDGGRVGAVNGNLLTVPAISAVDTAVSVSLGGGEDVRTILSFVDQAEAGFGNVWRLQMVSNNYVMRNNNNNANAAFTITGKNTTSDFGSGTPQPYKFAAGQIGIGNRRHTSGTAAPTTGAWGRGEIVWNESASAGGYAGWICVMAGTPGTWKRFGTIEA